jgi:hypothetical protein
MIYPATRRNGQSKDSQLLVELECDVFSEIVPQKNQRMHSSRRPEACPAFVPADWIFTSLRGSMGNLRFSGICGRK